MWLAILSGAFNKFGVNFRHWLPIVQTTESVMVEKAILSCREFGSHIS